jgi:hypothetical protein
MTESKYRELILTGLITDISHYTGKSLLSHNGELNADCSIGYHCISKPMSFDRPHAHDFTEFLCFIGGDPTDITDFGAEIEITLGDEGEKHKITSTSVVTLPPGLTHCPIVFTKVTKPLVFLEISLVRVWKPGGDTEEPPEGK